MDEASSSQPRVRDLAPVLDELPLVDPDLSPAQRMRIAFDLHEAGVQMRLQRFRRENPDATAHDEAVFLRRWYAESRDAVDGDTAGPVRRRWP